MIAILIGSLLGLISPWNHVESKDKSQENKLIVLLEEEVPCQKTSLRQKNFFTYSQAHLKLAQGQFSKALALFERMAHQSKPHSKTYKKAYEGMIQCWFELNQFDKIIALPPSLWDHFTDNTDIKIIQAKTYLQTNNTAKAHEIFKQLLSTNKNDVQILYYTVITALQNNGGDHSEAEALIDKALNNKQLAKKHFLFYLLHSKIKFMQGKLDDALHLAEKSVSLYPEFTKGILFKAFLHEQKSQITSAKAGYQKFLTITGRDESIEKHLVNLLFSHGRFAEAAEELNKIKSEEPAYFYDLALLEWKAGSYKSALEHIEKALAKNKNFTKARLLKVEILLACKEDKKLLLFMKEWLNEKTKRALALQTVLLLRKTRIPQTAIISLLKNVCTTESRSSSPSPLPLLALADLYLEKHNYKEALEVYQKALPQIQNRSLKAKILFQAAYLYFEKQEFGKTISSLQEALKLRPHDPASNNLLAYTYATTNSHLELAHTLVNKSLKTDPRSPYYLDTKGLLFLKQGILSQARLFFQKALTLTPGDKIIQQHLDELAQVHRPLPTLRSPTVKIGQVSSGIMKK